MDTSRISFEKIKVKGSQLVDKIKELAHEGGARKVTIRKDGRILLEFPLTIGVGGATAAIMFTPQIAAVGALAALVSDVDVEIERLADEADTIEDDPASEGPDA